MYRYLSSFSVSSLLEVIIFPSNLPNFSDFNCILIQIIQFKAGSERSFQLLILPNKTLFLGSIYIDTLQFFLRKVLVMYFYC